MEFECLNKFQWINKNTRTIHTQSKKQIYLSILQMCIQYKVPKHKNGCLMFFDNSNADLNVCYLQQSVQTWQFKKVKGCTYLHMNVKIKIHIKQWCLSAQGEPLPSHPSEIPCTHSYHHQDCTMGKVLGKIPMCKKFR